jgi:Cu+-exporting ATPase
MAVDAPSRLELQIGGMTCAACAARVEKKLNKLDGVDANVNYATELATVVYDPAEVELAGLVHAVEAAGYTAGIAADPGARADPVRPLRVRFLVSLALTVPLLLIAMVPPLQFEGWKWVALGLSTPIVLWAGFRFHRAAAMNARHLTATMDTLVSLGTLAAWGWSLIVLVAGLDADVYFEVAGVTTTLILLGRYLEARARRSSRMRTISRWATSSSFGRAGRSRPTEWSSKGIRPSTSRC